MTERRAPVQGTTPGSITWAEHLEVWGAYAALYGVRQSAERIAERGGFGYLEIELFTGHAPRTFIPVQTPDHAIRSTDVS